MSANPNVYLHEIVRSTPGREDAYAASVTSLRFDPSRRAASDPAQRASGKVPLGLGQFRTIDTAGRWPCTINIWERSWASQAESLSRQFQDTARDTTMEDWWNRNVHLRSGGYDRIMVPAPYSPTRDELHYRGVKTDVVLQEILWLPFGEAERYLDALGERFLPIAKRLGIELLGAWSIAMRPRQVMTLIGARDWSAFAALGAAEDPALREWKAWSDERIERAEEQMLIPVRHDPLALRR